jgi:hypothetical protein
MTTKAAKGRYICAAGPIPMRRTVELLASSGWKDTKLPKMGLDCSVGDYAAKLGSYFQPKGATRRRPAESGREEAYFDTRRPPEHV